jgi:hypothetical protein
VSAITPTIRTLDVGELARLGPLIASYPFKPYRHYRVLSRRAQEAVLEAEVTSVAESPGGAVLVADDGRGRAALVLRRLPWDSGFFGVPMARIDYLLRSTESDARLAGAVVDAGEELCRAEGIQHVSARLDVGDTLAIGVLEDRGFRLMDALVTYTYHPKREPPPSLREMGVLREFRPEDGDALVEIARESYRGFRGRFHLDPHLSDERGDEMYVEWARQCVRGRMADRIFVTEDVTGRLMGFLAFRRREPVSSVGGVEIYGGGLGACRRDAPGAYMGLIRAGTVWAHGRGALAECQTQNYNFPTVRVYEAVGARYVRADYTFHAWYE